MAGFSTPGIRGFFGTPIDRQRIQPDADPLAVPTPKGILEGPDSCEMSPVELDAVGEYLQIVLDLIFDGLSLRYANGHLNGRYRAVSGETDPYASAYSTWTEQDQLSLDQKDDRCEIEVGRRVSKTCCSRY